MGRIRKVIEQIYATETPETLRSEGIDVIEAPGQFRNARTIVAGERELSARRFIICTGASPVAPPIPGLVDLPYLTYESFWDMKTLPRRMVIIGGGPIGCELAQACQRLGSRVALIEAMDRLLPNDEPEASKIVAQSLHKDGVDIQLSTQVTSANDLRQFGDVVLVAVGRRPVLGGLGLAAAGVIHTDRGITVDRRLRTSAKHIYAAGDCAGGYQFTHYAGFQGAMAVRNRPIARKRSRCRGIGSVGDFHRPRGGSYRLHGGTGATPTRRAGPGVDLAHGRC